MAEITKQANDSEANLSQTISVVEKENEQLKEQIAELLKIENLNQALEADADAHNFNIATQTIAPIALD